MCKCLINTKYFLIGFIFLISVNYTLAQGNITIYGTVIDAETGENLPFAGIQISGSLLGGISDEQGKFEFIVPAQFATNPILFSYTGHKKREIAIRHFTNDNEVIVELVPLYKAVNEIIIRPMTTTELIEKCYTEVANNYPQQPLVHVGKYRELAFENDVNILDASATIYIRKTAYRQHKKRAERVKITDVKVVKTPSYLPIWEQMIIINGLHELLLADFVKYRKQFLQLPSIKINFLNPKEYKHYTYTYTEKRVQQDSGKYIIKFKPKKSSKKGVYEGYIEVDMTTFAFTKLHFSYSPERMKRVWKIGSIFELDMRRTGILIHELGFLFEISYKKEKGKYVPERIFTTNKFSYEEYYGAGENIITISEEYQLTKIDYKNTKQFRQKDCIAKGVIISKQNTFKSK